MLVPSLLKTVPATQVKALGAVLVRSKLYTYVP